MTCKLHEQRRNALSKSEIYDLAGLLLRWGYKVEVTSERPPGKDTGPVMPVIKIEGK